MGFEMLFKDAREAVRRLLRDWRFTSAAVLIPRPCDRRQYGHFQRCERGALAAPAVPRSGPSGGYLRERYLRERPRRQRPELTSYPASRDMAEYTDIFAGLTAVSVPVPARYRDQGSLRSALVEYATSTYPSVLGLQPSLGQCFSAEEEVKGADTVGIVGHRTWTRDWVEDFHFGAAEHARHTTIPAFQISDFGLKCSICPISKFC
jgi:hypothetical protein